MYDVLRRGDAVAVVLYDPDRDRLVLVEQFRLPPLYGRLLAVAGRSRSPASSTPGETPEAVARRETREEAGISIRSAT